MDDLSFVDATELAARIRARDLSPLEAVDAAIARIEALKDAGMVKLSISADPYHQQFVPLERCRLAARVAADVLGTGRVQVRWRDWLADGCDTDALSGDDRRALFARWAAAGRDRWGGRAVDELAPQMQRKGPEAFADTPCRQVLLRSRHVHIDAAGRVMPGTCAGIVLGTADATTSVSQLWQALEAERDRRPIISDLVRGGPVDLLERAVACGFVPADDYAGKCELCWDIRRHLVGRGMFGETLGPAWLYGPNCGEEPDVEC